MKKHTLRNLFSLITCSLLLSCSSTTQQDNTIDLSGEWGFKIDKGNIGKQEQWFKQSFEEVVTLPGTTDENAKGDINENVEVNYLTKKYWYEGKVWYQREVDIPVGWENKNIQLFLERTKATEVWVDGVYFPQQKSIATPHIYDVSKALSVGKHTITILVDNSLDLFPVGGSHALAIHTQTNWNGIIGKMELIAKDKVHISSVKLTPNVKNKEVKAEIKLVNPDQEHLKGELAFEANGFNDNIDSQEKQSFKFSSNNRNIVLTQTYKMGKDFKTWDEFVPNLYKMSITLKAKGDDESYQDVETQNFGMLDFHTQGTQFVANGKTIMLRGKHDACVFPLTGYPPMEKEGWVKYLNICKDYGLNHVRFHSWTPPEAAFEAADEVGIYMQTELPNWRSFLRDDTLHYNYQMHEGENILDFYANHPSLVMMSLGNELGGDRDFTGEVVDSFKAYDDRILFAQGSNNYFWDPGAQYNEDFLVSARVQKREDNFVNDIRASFSYIDCPEGGLINGQFPNTERTFESAVSKCKVPAIGHETGQYQILPNFDEIPKYTGVFEARNFEVFKQRMKDKNMYAYWKELYQASGKHAAMCYKEDNEISMRTPGFGGFQILDLQDFPGQGTALVGMLDALMDSKGFVTPKQWRQSCAAQTIQAEMPRLVWQNNEEFTANLVAINYGASDMVNQSISWQISNQNGDILNQGKTESANYAQGGITKAGAIKASLQSISKAQKLTLSLSTQEGEITNTYEIWVFPVIENIGKAKDIKVVSILDDAILKELKDGGKVLLIPDAENIAENSVGGLFMSDYWCYPMFKQICESNNHEVSPGTLGLLINDQHPVFKEFLTENHSDWQWWSLMKKSHPIILDETSADYRPIVQAVDNFERCSKLGLLFEFAVGNGKLMVCSIDLSDPKDFVAKTFLKSTFDYMSSEQFKPSTKISPDSLIQVIYGNGEKALNTRKTNDEGNTSGYNLLK